MEGNMDAIKNFVTNINDKLGAILEPILQKIADFLEKQYYLVYGAIALLLVFLVLPGLFTMLKKAGKFFIFLLVLLAIVVALWYFFVFKATI